MATGQRSSANDTLLKPKNLSCRIVHLHSESDRTCLRWILGEGYATPSVYNLNVFFLLKIVRNGSPRRRKNIRRTSSARKRF